MSSCSPPIRRIKDCSNEESNRTPDTSPCWRPQARRGYYLQDSARSGGKEVNPRFATHPKGQGWVFSPTEKRLIRRWAKRLSSRQIGAKLGRPYYSIEAFVRRNGISLWKTRPPVLFCCDWCKSLHTDSAARYWRAKNHFCSMACKVS